MTPRQACAEPNAVRPQSIHAEQENYCQGCRAHAKIETALEMLDLFLNSTRITQCQFTEDSEIQKYQYELKPKEEAAYLAALDKLERYLDSED